jgi:hypothetical protein
MIDQQTHGTVRVELEKSGRSHLLSLEEFIRRSETAVAGAGIHPN